MCIACAAGAAVDQGKSDAFAERMVSMLNGAALTLMVSVGHRTGLFDALDGAGWLTSSELALRAGLQERYVREWLGAMTAGAIVEHDGQKLAYRLPAEHAAWLTRRASPNNLAVVAQFIPSLAQAEDGIVGCFREGGGLGYERYPRFHEVMAEDSGQTVVAALREHILPLAEGLEATLRDGARVMDLGCGRGKALMELAAAFTASEFLGVDFSRDAVSWAQAEADRRGLTNVRFEAADAAQIDFDESFDVIFTFDAIHDQARPDVVLENIRRALRPGGVYLMQDIAGAGTHAGDIERPFAPFVYTVSCMHCMSVSLAAGGMGLGAAWGEPRALAMLQEAGFTEVELRHLPHDFQNAYYIVRK